MNAIAKRRAAAGQSGFTLIELLVVIAILGILAGVVVFAVGNTTDSAKSKACQLEIRSIKTAAEAFKGIDTSGVYPTDFAAMTGSGDGSFLEEVPASAKWTYTQNGGGTGYTVTGLGQCASYSFTK